MKNLAVIALTQGGASTARSLKSRVKKQGYKVDLVLPQRLARDDENYYSRGAFTATIHHLLKNMIVSFALWQQELSFVHWLM